MANSGSKPEDESRRDLAGQHLIDCPVHFLDAPTFADHPSLLGGVERENLGEVLTSPHDRSDDRDSLQHGLEDRDIHLPTSRQGNADEPPAPTEGR